jgi:hypothetical protein
MFGRKRKGSFWHGVLFSETGQFHLQSTGGSALLNAPGFAVDSGWRGTYGSGSFWGMHGKPA